MAYQDYQYLRVAVDDRICRATIDNPPINLADLNLFGEVAVFAQEVAGDDCVNVVIVDSADPDFFVAHADVAMLQGLPTDDTTLHDELSPFHTVVELFRTMPKATIAVIEGIARGGGSEFALAFDMRFAALGKARLAQPEVAGPAAGRAPPVRRQAGRADRVVPARRDRAGQTRRRRRDRRSHARVEHRGSAVPRSHGGAGRR